MALSRSSLLADLVDYDIWRNGKDRAAIFFSFQALVTKLNQGHRRETDLVAVKPPRLRSGMSMRDLLGEALAGMFARPGRMSVGSQNQAGSY